MTSRKRIWLGLKPMFMLTTAIGALLITGTMLIVHDRSNGNWPSEEDGENPMPDITSSRGTPLFEVDENESWGPWQVRYTGFGTAHLATEEILLEPQSAKNQDITHGGLVHTQQIFDQVDFSVTVHTEEQVRNGPPNPWEVGWVLWNFQDDSHFYAVALKPNGWEITKQDPKYPGEQRFLATDTTPVYPINQDYRVEVVHSENTFTVTVDGKELATVTDEQSPYTNGAIGVYTEDARVLFSDFDLPPHSTNIIANQQEN